MAFLQKVAKEVTSLLKKKIDVEGQNWEKYLFTEESLSFFLEHIKLYFIISRM